MVPTVADFVRGELLKGSPIREDLIQIEIEPAAGGLVNIVAIGNEDLIHKSLRSLDYLAGFAHCQACYELLSKPVNS